MKLLIEKSKEGSSSYSIPETVLNVNSNILDTRENLNLPELPEVEVVRHYTNLSKLNFGVDNGFYPLGSCTMKYNPKLNEDISRNPLMNVNPYSENAEGCLQIIFELEKFLCEITGMKAFSLQPAAGAHGELTGIMLMKAYFEDKGEKRSKILIPDSAHGTNPASVTLCGFDTIQIKSSPTGGVDIDDLKEKMTEDVVGLMLTNPNTLGIFDENITQITSVVHDKGGLCYMDGANMNAMMGIVKPYDLGFDVLHLNLHKSFSTPHGGGGPGSGPVGVNEKLIDFLPGPGVVKKEKSYVLENVSKKSIGRVHSYFGNFNVYLKAYSYIRAIGAEGVRRVGEISVLNANYMKEKLKKEYNLAFDRKCAHEFVIDDSLMSNHVTTNDIAKRLIDYGFHPPTVYFPLIVHGAIMIEPTETESKERMDDFIEAMIKIKKEAEIDPNLVKTAPHYAPSKRLDAVSAARNPQLKWCNLN